MTTSAYSFQEMRARALQASDDGQLDQAEAECRRLLEQAPHDVQGLFLLGLVLHRTGRDPEAIVCLGQAAELQPETAQIHAALGCAYAGANAPARALDCYAQSLALDPRQADIYYSMGSVCHRIGDLERAVEHFRMATTLNPVDPESWHNLGKSLRDLNRIGDALAAYDRALALAPSFGLARYGRALALLTAGRWAEGFPAYEARRSWRSPGAGSPPAWRGEPIPGKVLLCHDEQGFGDVIQAVRFLAPLRERSTRVILECRRELFRLFAHSQCADEVIMCGQPLPPFDVCTIVFSLPGLLGTTLETVPNRVPYLRAPPPKAPLAVPPGQFKVGLVWAGNPTHDGDARRSLAFADLAPLLATPGIAFFSLQVPPPKRDEACRRAFPNLVDLGPCCADFLDTASFLQQLDLTITVDTAVAHLAGALGRPVWTLITHCPDWRWLLDRADTVWYPTMRLFRQPVRGQWGPVIAQVARELAHWVPPQANTPR